WTPVRVTLDGGEQGLRGQLVIVVADADGVPVRFVPAADNLNLAPGQQQTVTCYARFGRVRERLGVQVGDGQTVSWETWVEADEIPAALPATRELFLTIGPEVGLAEMVANNLRHSPQGATSSRLDDPQRLPTDWCGYEGVDVIVLTTSQTELLDRISDQQLAALEQAIRMGGRMLWCVGRRGGEVFRGDSRWNRFAPGEFAGVRGIRDTTSLESFAGAMEPLDAVPGFSRITGLAASTFKPVAGRIELSETAAGGERVPLLIRYPYSFGQLTLLTLDLDEAPFDAWASRPRFAAMMLQTIFDNRAERSGDSSLGQVSHVGYDDLVGQLRGALDQFPGVTLVAFSWVAVLIGMYILLIGPGDYFLLRKLLGRMHWSWITFPLVVILFAGLAWYLAGRVRSPTLLLNQVDILDFDAASQFGRSTTWTHIYSPQAGRYDLRLPDWHPQSQQRGTASLLAWQGLPGKGLGGMAAAQPVLGQRAGYSVAAPGGGAEPSEGRVDGLPVLVSATRSLVARRRFDWTAEAESDLELRYDNNLLRGSFRNPLPVTLTGSAVMYGDWVYSLEGDLPPGATVRLQDLPPPRVLEWRLTRRRVVEQEAISLRWDASQIDDPARLVEVMMFHRAAGGQRYTQLSHRYQGYLDLSDHLQAGRAILVGRSREPAAALVRDGQALDEHYRQRWTWCRVVYPVRVGTAQPAAMKPEPAATR
ncbi:MAG: hypothetical protein J5I93_12670, partial [Pirellulaceae bacterium]|nr:hypothetical protein [Pirellulaceae bacterium]